MPAAPAASSRGPCAPRGTRTCGGGAEAPPPGLSGRACLISAQEWFAGTPCKFQHAACIRPHERLYQLASFGCQVVPTAPHLPSSKLQLPCCSQPGGQGRPCCLAVLLGEASSSRIAIVSRCRTRCRPWPLGAAWLLGCHIRSGACEEARTAVRVAAAPSGSMGLQGRLLDRIERARVGNGPTTRHTADGRACCHVPPICPQCEVERNCYDAASAIGARPFARHRGVKERLAAATSHRTRVRFWREK
jgi:hypothetical protein